MPFRSGTRNKTSTLDQEGLKSQWPRIWIMIIGIILIVLCFSIAGMEVGNTLSDLRRATAFGGFIVFLPLLACAVLVLVTAFKPGSILRRITMILCIIMIILCLVLIAYDIVIVVDPTRCFFFDCNGATVNVSNSTNNIVVSAWPLNVAWPSYFQTNMNAKRIFQSVQMFCAILFIICAVLFIIIHFKYGTVNSHKKKDSYNADQPESVTQETVITPVTVESFPQDSRRHLITTYTIDNLTKHSNDAVQPYPQDSPNHLITSYTTDNPTKHSNDTVQPYPHDSPNHLITTYTIDNLTKYSNDAVQPYPQDSPNHLITSHTIDNPTKHSNDTVQPYPHDSPNHLITSYTPDNRTKHSRDTVQSNPQDSRHHAVTSYTKDDPTERSNDRVPSYAQDSSNQFVTSYIIDNPSSLSIKSRSSPESVVIHKKTARKTKKKTYLRPRANSIQFNRICKRCLKEPRIVLTTVSDRQNYYSHLCVNCNNEVSRYHHKRSVFRPTDNRGWKA